MAIVCRSRSDQPTGRDRPILGLGPQQPSSMMGGAARLVPACWRQWTIAACHDDRHLMLGVLAGVMERLQDRLATIASRTDGHVIGAGSAGAAVLERAVSFGLGRAAPCARGFVGPVSVFRGVIDRDRGAFKGHKVFRNRSRGSLVDQDDAGRNLGRFAPAVSLALDRNITIASKREEGSDCECEGESGLFHRFVFLERSWDRRRPRYDQTR
jgi:hypothetical protein